MTWVDAPMMSAFDLDVLIRWPEASPKVFKACASELRAAGEKSAK
jgi:hypothetical protein